MIKGKRPNATWRVERVYSSPGLYRLIGPLVQQVGKKKTMCIAIGSGRRLKPIAKVLNDFGLEI